jgi:hypothetical protein
MRKGGPTESPLGFWLETVFNHISFVNQTKGPVLKMPPISAEQIYYPIKASYFEDVQQREFWVSEHQNKKNQY